MAFAPFFETFFGNYCLVKYHFKFLEVGHMHMFQYFFLEVISYLYDYCYKWYAS